MRKRFGLALSSLLALSVAGGVFAQDPSLDAVATRLDLPAATKFELSQGEVAAPQLYGNPSVLYAFSVTEDALIRIHAESPLADTVLGLYDDQLNEVAWNDDWWGADNDNWHSLISQPLSPGTYYLMAGGYWAHSEGQVRLTITAQSLELEVDQQLSVPASVELILSELMPQAGKYSGPGHLFSFDLTEPQVVELRALSDDVDTVLVLYDEAMNELADNDDWSGDAVGWESRIIRQLDAGTYHVIVGAYWSGDTGLVQFSLSELDVIAEGGGELGIPDAAEVLVDDHLPAVGHYSGPGQTFRFSLAEPAVVVIRAESADVDTVLVLHDSDMNMITHNDDWYGGAGSANWESQIAERLESGDYYVTVGGYWPSSQGVLTLSIEYGSDSLIHDWPSAPQLGVPESTVVHLEEDMPPAGENFSGPGQVFRLTVPRDMQLQVSAASAASSDRHIDAVLILYDSARQLIAYNDDNYGDWSEVSGKSRITELVEAGEYYLVVGSYFSRSGAVDVMIEAVDE